MRKTLKNFVDAGYKKKSEAQEVNGYILDPDLSTKRDKIYVNPDNGQVVHTIAGTDSLKDWSNNALIPLGLHGLSNRYKNSEKIQKKANEKYGKTNVSVVSHSQSGNIAERLADKHLIGGDNTSLNPAIIGSHNKDMKVYKSIIDPVSLLTNTNRNDVHIIPRSLNPIYEHSSEILGYGINYIKGKNVNNDNMKSTVVKPTISGMGYHSNIHEQDIIDRIAKLSHDIHQHHGKFGYKPDILKGFKLLGKGISKSICDKEMTGGKINRNKKFNTWFKDIGQKFLPLNKNLSPIKHAATQAAVDEIEYQTMTPFEQAQEGVDIFQDLIGTDSPPKQTEPQMTYQEPSYNQMYQPVIAQPVAMDKYYYDSYDAGPSYYQQPTYYEQPSSYDRSWHSAYGSGFSGRMPADPGMTIKGSGRFPADPGMTIKGSGRVGNMLKQSAADAVVRLLNSGSERASHEMSTRGKKGKGVYGGNDGQQYTYTPPTKLYGRGATGNMLKNTAANATANLINAGSDRAASEMTTQGTGLRRRGRPKGCGATGNMLKNTAANATANLINAGSDRAASEMTTQGTGLKRGRFKKGSQEARDHMARIRAMKR